MQSPKLQIPEVRQLLEMGGGIILYPLVVAGGAKASLSHITKSYHITEDEAGLMQSPKLQIPEVRQLLEMGGGIILYPLVVAGGAKASLPVLELKMSMRRARRPAILLSSRKFPFG